MRHGRASSDGKSVSRRLRQRVQAALAPGRTPGGVERPGSTPSLGPGHGGGGTGTSGRTAHRPPVVGLTPAAWTTAARMHRSGRRAKASSRRPRASSRARTPTAACWAAGPRRGDVRRSNRAATSVAERCTSSRGGKGSMGSPPQRRPFQAIPSVVAQRGWAISRSDAGGRRTRGWAGPDGARAAAAALPPDGRSPHGPGSGRPRSGTPRRCPPRGRSCGSSPQAPAAARASAMPPARPSPVRSTSWAPPGRRTHEVRPTVRHPWVRAAVLRPGGVRDGPPAPGSARCSCCSPGRRRCHCRSPRPGTPPRPRLRPELLRAVLRRPRRCSRFLRIGQLRYQRVHRSGEGPSPIGRTCRRASSA